MLSEETLRQALQQKIPEVTPRSGYLAAFALLILFASVNADAQIKFGLTPAMIDMEFAAGEPFAVTLEVSNGGNLPMSMHGEAMDFWYDAKNEKIFAAPGTMPHSATAWIEFVPRTFIVPPHGASKVKMMVTPPANTAGSFYSVAFLESKPELSQPAGEGKQAIYTNIRLGALVLLASRQSQSYSVAVSDLKVTPPGLTQPLQLDFEVQNDSNTHIFPKSSVVIVDSQHKVWAKAVGEVKRFLPGQKDRLGVVWSGRLPPGSYDGILNLTYGQAQSLIRQFHIDVTDSGDETPAKSAEEKTDLARQQ